MTLDDLSKPPVQIILGIREGHGFGFLNSPIVVVAGLDGHRLETDVIQPACDPTFDVELVWEAESKNIKRLKQANTPVKVECFTVSNSSPQKRDRLGFVLLGLRQAQVAPREKKIPLAEAWHRLVGVRSDMKALSPEMLLTLSIEDSPDQNGLSRTEMGDFCRDGGVHGHQGSHQKICPSSLVPQLYADEGHVQIGPPATATDLFKFRINIAAFGNLIALLPEGSRRQLLTMNGGGGGGGRRETGEGGGGGSAGGGTGLTVSFSVMGYSVQVRVAPRDLAKDVFRSEGAKNTWVRSNLHVLRAYFSENRLLFRLTTDDNMEVGTTVLHLKGLIMTDSLAVFDKEKGCALDTRCYIGLNKLDCTSKPYLDISVQLTHERPPHAHATTHPHPHPQQKQANSSVGGYGDVGGKQADVVHKTGKPPGERAAPIETIMSPRKRSPQTVTVPSLDLDRMLPQPPPLEGYGRPGTAFAPKRMDRAAMAPPPPPPPPGGSGNQTYRATDQQLHSFVLSVTLESVTFRKLPADNRFIFRLHHAHALAEVVCAVHQESVVERPNEKVLLRPVIDAEIRFTSGIDEINGILLAEQPLVRVCDSDGVFAVATLHTGILLSQDDNKECAYTASLESEGAAGRGCGIGGGGKPQPLGLLNVTMSLKDCGLLIKKASNMQCDGAEAADGGGRGGFDKRVAVRVVEELEDWKEKQQEIFKNELKRKECQHLAVLSSEWTERRLELEENLNRNVEQCRTLALSLNEASDKMRDRARLLDEKERELSKAEIELERKFSSRLQEMREASRRMEADVNHKVSLLTVEKTELLDRLNFMEREKRRLARTVQSLETEIEALRCGGLTKEQVAKVLQEMKAVEEKLDAALESKSFFKAQWGKAVREIHRLKTEHQQAIQNQLQNERHELQRLNSGFCERLNQQVKEQESQMFQDRTLLQELRMEAHDTFSPLHPKGQGQGRSPRAAAGSPPPAQSGSRLFFPGPSSHTVTAYLAQPHQQQQQQQYSTQGGNAVSFDFSKAQVQKLLEQHLQYNASSGPAEVSNRDLLAGLNSQVRQVLSQAQAQAQAAS